MSVKITQDAIDAWYAKASKAEKSKFETYKNTHDSNIKTLEKKYNDANNEVNGWATANANIKAGSKPASKTTFVQVFPDVEVYPYNIRPWTNFVYFNEPLPSGSGTLFTLNEFYAEKYRTGGSGYGWPQTANALTGPSASTLSTGKYVLVYLAWANSFYTNPAVIKYFNRLIYIAGTTTGEPAGTAATLQDYITKYQARAKEVTKLFAQQKTALDKAKQDIAAENADYEGKLRNLIYKTGVGTSTTSGSQNPPATPTNATSPVTPPGYTLGTDVEFNLPPHQWSLPTRPVSIDPETNPNSVNDFERRGRFWTWKESDQKFTTQAADKVDAVGRTRNVKKYGFQFLWNPETWSSNVQINPDVTPNSPQYWASSLPVFPSGQNMSFNIVIDRVNDFACFGPKLAEVKPTNSWSPFLFTDANNAARLALEAAREKVFTDFSPFYDKNVINPAPKIEDLLKRGTLADIEYIYKVCNGDGWKRLDQNTSDIGFLMMTLVEIELGPNRYLGYLNSLGIEHTMFTENMIPIRSNVSLQFVLMASARVAAKAK